MKFNIKSNALSFTCLFLLCGCYCYYEIPPSKINIDDDKEKILRFDYMERCWNGFGHTWHVDKIVTPYTISKKYVIPIAVAKEEVKEFVTLRTGFSGTMNLIDSLNLAAVRFYIVPPEE